MVGGVEYRHSAAKFWARLIDEAFALFPSCSRLELSVLTAEMLDPVRLDPQAELRRDIDLLMDQDLQGVIQDTLAQLTAFGPPSLVRLRVWDGACELGTQELPADAVDAETFIYLAGWLLEWSRIPHEAWTGAALDGQVVARDRRRQRVYHLPFSARREHISEGLYRISVALDPRVAERGS